MQAIEPLAEQDRNGEPGARRIEKLSIGLRLRVTIGTDRIRALRGHLENLLLRKSKVALVERLAAPPYVAPPGFMADLAVEPVSVRWPCDAPF